MDDNDVTKFRHIEESKTTSNDFNLIEHGNAFVRYYYYILSKYLDSIGADTLTYTLHTTIFGGFNTQFDLFNGFEIHLGGSWVSFLIKWLILLFSKRNELSGV